MEDQPVVKRHKSAQDKETFSDLLDTDTKIGRIEDAGTDGVKLSYAQQKVRRKLTNMISDEHYSIFMKLSPEKQQEIEYWCYDYPGGLLEYLIAEVSDEKDILTKKEIDKAADLYELDRFAEIEKKGDNWKNVRVRTKIKWKEDNFRIARETLTAMSDPNRRHKNTQRKLQLRVDLLWFACETYSRYSDIIKHAAGYLQKGCVDCGAIPGRGKYYVDSCCGRLCTPCVIVRSDKLLVASEDFPNYQNLQRIKRQLNLGSSILLFAKGCLFEVGRAEQKFILPSSTLDILSMTTKTFEEYLKEKENGRR
ncbi:MAG: hypothetical protein ACI8RD_013155 [Bacillariaceae sp.]|jgi:hypothetical protein